MKAHGLRSGSERWAALWAIPGAVAALTTCQGSFSASLDGSRVNSQTAQPAPPAAATAVPVVANTTQADQAPSTASAGAAASQKSASNATSAKAFTAPTRALPSGAIPAPVAAGHTSDPCDIRNTDWANFSYGQDKLKDGYEASDVRSSPNEPPLEGYGTRLLSDKFEYGDLNKNGKLEAYVPIGECSPEACDTTIWIFENNSGCHPQMLIKLKAYSGSGGSVSGDRYIYIRRKDFNVPNSERVEVQFVKGHFTEVKSTVIPNE